MKSAFESEATFTAHATISAGYYMIEQLQKEFNAPKSAITAAVDKATGYDKKLELDYINQLIACFEDIIEAKKVIEDDYSKDAEALTIANQYLKQIQPKP